MRFFVFLCLLVFSTLQAQKEQPNNWVADIDFIQKELPQKHINVFHKLAKKDFDAQCEALKRKAPNMHPEAVLWSITKIISNIEDSHTQLLFSTNENFPINIQWFKDGYYITAAERKNEAFLASKIIKINGNTVDAIENQIASVVYSENEASKKKLTASLLKNVSLLTYLGIIKQKSVLLEIITPNNKKDIIRFSLNPAIKSRGQMAFAIPQEIPLFMQNIRAWFWNTNLDNNNALYIKYNACNSREALVANNQLRGASEKQISGIPSFNEFAETMLSQLNNTPYKKLIFDIRGNSGGSSKQGTDFLEAIKQTSFYKNGGKVYTLIDRDVFSSAIINTVNSKDFLNATIIGEATSGAPNHFGELKTLELPHSKLKLQYSTKQFKLVKGNANTITPDILIETSIHDFISGYDPVLEKALSL